METAHTDHISESGYTLSGSPFLQPETLSVGQLTTLCDAFDLAEETMLGIANQPRAHDSQVTIVLDREMERLNDMRRSMIAEMRMRPKPDDYWIARQWARVIVDWDMAEPSETLMAVAEMIIATPATN